MDTQEAITSRRSIRKFQHKPIPRELLERLLELSIQAPSGKNNQPWRFVIVQGEERDRMVEVLREGIERCRREGVDLGSSESTARVMAEAPVTVFIFNPHAPAEGEDSLGNVVDIQSVGGMIQTMLLAAAQSLGLGSLWICDVFYGGPPLREWLGREDQMVAAVSLGYPAEAPPPRPRTPWSEITTWRG